MGNNFIVIGLLLILAGGVVSVFFNYYGLIIFPALFGLGCIIMGLGKIIKILEEIKNNLNKNY